MKHIGIFFLFLIIGFGGIAIFQFTRHTATPFTKPQLPVSTFSLKNAPRQSLKGSVTALSGNVLWLSRIATEPVHITTGQSVQQGEEIATQDKGIAQIEFPSAALLNLSSNTIVDFEQTLPINLVFNEQKGTATYKKESTIPISIRGLDLLVAIASGSSTITVDAINQLVTVSVLNGQTTLAYNDINYLSHVVSFSKGQEVIFDDNAKTLSQ